MVIFAKLKYSKKEQASNLDVEKVRQRHIIGFTLIGLAIATHAFDFVASLNINCLMSKNIDRISRIDTSLLASFLGL
jgi:hypothetical protein